MAFVDRALCRKKTDFSQTKWPEQGPLQAPCVCVCVQLEDQGHPFTQHVMSFVLLVHRNFCRGGRRTGREAGRARREPRRPGPRPPRPAVLTRISPPSAAEASPRSPPCGLGPLFPNRGRDPGLPAPQPYGANDHLWLWWRETLFWCSSPFCTRNNYTEAKHRKSRL